jgi:uncharacterized surface protein with fasciclin (FAS1) repeats
MRRLVVALVLAVVLSVPSTALASPAREKGNIVEVLASKDKYSRLVHLVTKADLVEALSGDTQLTVFAPKNKAFKRLPDGVLRQLKRHPEQLREVLLYHVLAGRYPAQRIVELEGAETLQGGRVTFRVKCSKVYVNDARVVQPDIKASNGIIHGIKRVLIPPS